MESYYHSSKGVVKFDNNGINVARSDLLCPVFIDWYQVDGYGNVTFLDTSVTFELCSSVNSNLIYTVEYDYSPLIINSGGDPTDPGNDPTDPSDDGEEIEPDCAPGTVPNGNGGCMIVLTCETDNAMINALAKDKSFETIWRNSKLTGPSVPMSSRLEQGGWVTFQNNKYKYTPFPNDWIRTPCGIDPPVDWENDIPNNLVGWIHIHPFYLGEDRRSICGENVEEKYIGGASKADYKIQVAFMNESGNFSFTGITIDGNVITATDQFRQNKTYTRCSY